MPSPESNSTSSLPAWIAAIAALLAVAASILTYFQVRENTRVNVVSDFSGAASIFIAGEFDAFRLHHAGQPVPAETQRLRDQARGHFDKMATALNKTQSNDEVDKLIIQIRKIVDEEFLRGPASALTASAQRAQQLRLDIVKMCK